MRKIITIFILLSLIFSLCARNQNPPKKKNTDIEITKKLMHLPKLNVPKKVKNLEKTLKYNGFIREESFVGMAEDRNNQVYNNKDISIFVTTLNKNYYGDKISKSLDKEFRKGFTNNLLNKQKISFLKQLNKNAYIYCFSEKDKYINKIMNKRQIIIKLSPDKILTLSCIKFNKMTNNKIKQKRGFNRRIQYLSNDIAILNKIFVTQKSKK